MVFQARIVMANLIKITFKSSQFRKKNKFKERAAFSYTEEVFFSGPVPYDDDVITMCVMQIILLLIWRFPHWPPGNRAKMYSTEYCNHVCARVNPISMH